MLRVNSFDLAGYTRAPDPSEASDNERIAELRSVIRESIARGITLVLDRERFMRRIVDIISESSGYPAVVAYLREAGTAQLSLVAGTDDAPLWLPRRLDPNGLPGDGPQVVNSALAFDVFEFEDEQQIAAVPIGAQDELLGYILILDLIPAALDAEDLEALAVMAEEIAPAVLVAIHHHQMRQSSVIDLPTGAYTYDFFIQRLEEELARAHRTGHSVTIVLVEIWHIEHLEDVAGYERADDLLRELASGISAVMRTSDVVARRRRTGFALLLPESDVVGADLTIERIHEQLRRIRPEFDELPPNGPQPVVVAGSSTFPSDGQTAAELVLAADQRMFAVADEIEIAGT